MPLQVPHGAATGFGANMMCFESGVSTLEKLHYSLLEAGCQHLLKKFHMKKKKLFLSNVKPR